jgi:hypothetical protein
MTVRLPRDVEISINQAVLSGRFASMDDAMTEAARLLLQSLNPVQSNVITSASSEPTPDPLLGLWADYADEMDEIVADAYRHRQEDLWREVDL